MEISVLDVAFVLAVTAFLKEQFGFENKVALGAAFAVSLIVGLAPQIAALVPAFAGWFDAVLNVVKIFLAAAGSYDFAVGLLRKREELTYEVELNG